MKLSVLSVVNTNDICIARKIYFYILTVSKSKPFLKLKFAINDQIICIHVIMYKPTVDELMNFNLFTII